MRYGKLAVAFLSVLLIALVALCLRVQMSAQAPEEMPLSISVHTDTNTETIRCRQSDDGSWYAFLPSYAGMDRAFFQIPDGSGCTLDGIVLSDGMVCSAFQPDTPYSLTWSQGESTLTFVKSGGVASMYINVQSGSMEYIHLEKGNEEQGRMRRYRPDGSLNYSGTLSSLQGRGNSSWNAEKKPYSMTLAEDGDLLDMGAAQRWILLAEGYNPINIRNKIVYDFAREVGLPYTPECQWVDLYLNGEYAGLYLLSERNEVHPQRIDIPEKSSSVVSLETEEALEQQKLPFVLTQAGQALRVRHGAADRELLQRWQSVENAILSEDGVDPITGKCWQELIDLDSWARKYLIEEIFANMDAGSLSQYFYFDAGDPEGKAYAGPVWDYDFAMGGEYVWLRPYTDYFTMDRTYPTQNRYTPWFAALCDRDAFMDRVRELYVLEFLPHLNALIDSRISQYAQQILAAAESDRIRWGLSEAGVRQEPEYIRSFLESRRDFLSDLWIFQSSYHTVQVILSSDAAIGYFAVRDGKRLPALPSVEDLGGIGWYCTETGEPFDINEPITESISISVKKPESGIGLIHFLPLAAIVASLPLAVVLNEFRTKQNGSKKDVPVKTK